MPKLTLDLEEYNTLKEHYEQYRKILDTSPVGIFTTTFDGKILYVNAAILELFEFETSADMKRHGVLERYKKPSDRERMINQLRENGEVKNFEIEALTSTGATKHILLSASAEGAVISGMIVDITERKRAAEAVYESEQKFRTLAEKSPNMIFINHNGRIVYANHTCREIMGYTREELYSESFDFMNLIAQESKDLVKKNFIEHMKGSEVPPAEYRLVTKDKAVIDAIHTTKLIEYHGDKAILGVVTDVTERKRIENELKESKERYRSLVELIPLPVVVHTGTKILYINNAGTKLLSFKNREELVGMSLLDCIHPANQKHLMARLDELQHMGAKEHTGELQFIRPDGTPIEIEVYSTPTTFMGKPARQVVLRDLTADKEDQKKLQELNKKLAQANKQLKTMTLKDSHTGLYNYRFLQESIKAEFDRAKRLRDPLSVIMFDIDYFKAVNDIYGHQFGDLVLKQLGELLTNNVRRYDMVTRFGGEEFIVLAAATGRAQAIRLAKRLQEIVGSFPFGSKQRSANLKISGSVASYPSDPVQSGSDLITLADRILGKVKEDGGANVYSSSDLPQRSAGEETGSSRSDAKIFKTKVKKLAARADKGITEAILALSKTIALRDGYTEKDIEATVRLAVRLAQALGLPKHQVNCVEHAAALHDLGKAGVDDHILRKETELTRKEFEEVKKHPEIGADMIEPVRAMREVGQLILHHHERWDGTGYPFGLKQHDIPLGARIIFLADVYRALVARRPYRGPYSQSEARKIIRKEAGTKLDPQVVGVFLKIFQH